ncbi:hypothetical protein D3C84_566460 [compost metagenome]
MRASTDRGPGRYPARRHGVDLQRPGIDFRPAQSPRQPPGPPLARARYRPGSAGRPGHATFARDDRRPAGDPQGWRRLCAAGPGLPGGAPALPDGRQRHFPADQPVLAAGKTAIARKPGGAGHRPRAAGIHGGQQPGQPDLRRKPRLPDLHLGLHRPAERRQRGPRSFGHALPVDRRVVWHDPGRPRTAIRLDQLRRRPRALADATGVRFGGDAPRRRVVERGAHLRRDRKARHHHRLFHPELPGADRRLHGRSRARSADPFLHPVR